MKSISTKTKADIETIFGKKMAGVVLGFRKPSWKKTPMSVSIVEVKPVFYVDDGGGLFCYAVNLETGAILGERYCGSGNSSINHPEQFDATAKAPDNHALIFIERYQSSGNCPWTVTVVSPNMTRQIS